MNLIDALKSGKRFKRKHWDTFYLNRQEWFQRKDVLADDWEVESDPVTITRAQLVEAWGNAFGWNEPYGSLTCDILADELRL